MKLFHSPNARSFRALWMIKELNLSNYTLVCMKFPPRAFHKDFLKVNPLGTIPYFVDGDVRMTESSGICHYLATKYGHKDEHSGRRMSLCVAPDEADFGAYTNWMFHSDATLTFPQALVLRYGIFEKDRQLQVVADDYSKWYLARLKLLDTALADGREFVCANRFTAADVSIGYALHLGSSFGLELEKSYKPQTLDYLARLRARAAFIAAEREQRDAALATSSDFL